jgi:hypothetical protein
MKKLIACTALLMLLPMSVHAQTPSKYKSLFFTDADIQRIEKASQGFVVKADIPDTMDETKVVEPETVDLGPRSLKLAGIVYNSDRDWTIWFNGMRVTPGNLPEGMLGLVVKKDRIALRWLDKGTQKVINLVLKPHQQYNIDSDTITAGTR